MILYRLAMAVAFPVLTGMALIEAVRGRIPVAGVAERLGGGSAPGRTDVWLHAASVGELTSVRTLLDAVLAARPALRLVITCNSGAGRALAGAWGLPRTQVALAPFDLGWTLARFVARHGPQALCLVESEFWPERIFRMAERPVAVVGARISARSAARWTRFAPGLMRRMLGGVRLLSAQDAGSEARFLGLGLAPERVGPRVMLKARIVPAEQAPPFAPPVPRARCLLAASSHPGEDEVVLDAFMAARRAGQFSHLILAPRHPQRASAIAALVARRGLTLARRSRGEVPGAATDVHLADTMGEMAHWYRMAGATVIGGTFGALGGHTPYEPAAYGSAILHGPDVANFVDAFAALDAAGGAVALAGASELAAALSALNDTAQTRLAANARAALERDDRTAELAAALIEVLER